MRRALAMSFVLLSFSVASMAEELDLASALAEATLPPTGGTLNLDRADGAPTVTFSKTSTEREFVGVTLALPPLGFEPQSLWATLELAGLEQETTRLACILWTDDGQAWYGVLQAPSGAFEGRAVEVSLPLTNLSRAAFTSAEGSIEWSDITRLWLGVVADDSGEGKVSIRSTALSTRPHRASEPLVLAEPGRPGSWDVGSDPSVQWELDYPEDGPDGQMVTEVRFRFPGSSHMYLTPAVTVPASLAGYRALRLVYQAALPDGIEGLLVMLSEDVAQFQGPTPPATNGEWAEVLLDLADFRLGDWSSDDDGRLDLSSVGRVFVGAHGTAEGTGGDGVIRIATIEFVP